MKSFVGTSNVFMKNSPATVSASTRAIPPRNIWRRSGNSGPAEFIEKLLVPAARPSRNSSCKNFLMALWEKLKFWSSPPRPEHLERGTLGEKAARDYLTAQGMKFLTANFSSRRGEIDLIFRDGESLVFVEVKTRSEGGWTRPSRAVDNRKRRLLIRTATDYLRLLKNQQVAWRYDVVEVILKDSQVNEVRHLRDSFNRSMLNRRRP